MNIFINEGLVDEEFIKTRTEGFEELAEIVKDYTPEKVAAGLAELKWSNSLEMAAMIRATEIKQSFSHTRPNGTAWYTVNQNDCYGENLARGFNTAEDTVTGWKNSPTHNANLMDPGFKTCAIAIYEENGSYYWAQEFGY